jgi:hypothetical protein
MDVGRTIRPMDLTDADPKDPSAFPSEESDVGAAKLEEMRVTEAKEDQFEIQRKRRKSVKVCQ